MFKPTGAVKPTDLMSGVTMSAVLCGQQAKSRRHASCSKDARANPQAFIGV
jgi:hypothetical protein